MTNENIDELEREAWAKTDALVIGSMLEQLRQVNELIPMERLNSYRQELASRISRSESIGFIWGDRGYGTEIKKLDLKVLTELIALLSALQEQAEKTPKLQGQEQSFKEMKKAVVL